MRKYLHALVMMVLVLPVHVDAGDDEVAVKSKASEWWQWALSIPASVNPLLDTTGQYCFVGQRGNTWFLAGFFGVGIVDRSCTIPKGKKLFFPVSNVVNFNAPNVCGQNENNTSVEQLYADAKVLLDNTIETTVELDGVPIDKIRRIKTLPFTVTLPEDNLFDAPCKDAGGVPAGIYKPTIDIGYYARIKYLEPREKPYTLHILAKSADGTAQQDITYHLSIVESTD